MKDQAAQMHLAGEPVRQIAKTLRVDKSTVASMVEDSSFLREYRRRLRERVPRALKKLDRALDHKNAELSFRAATWTLENTQVGVKKQEEEILHRDEFLGRSRSELEFYIQHGQWPEQSDPESTRQTTVVEAGRA